MRTGNHILKAIVLLIIASLFVSGLSGCAVYNLMKSGIDEITDKEDKYGNEIPGKAYNIDNYVEISAFDGKESITEVTFKNLPLGTTVIFMENHEAFLYPQTYGEEVTHSNTVVCGISNHILSVYTLEEVDWHTEIGYKYYSVNINLDNQKIVTNGELIEMYDLDIDDVYEKLLRNLVSTVEIDSFLLAVNGDVTAPKISISDFAKNIPDYAEMLNNRYDVFTLYIENNKVRLTYNQDEILNLLGMGSHMGVGFTKDPTIELN